MLGVVIGIVKVDNSLVVRLDYFLGQQNSVGKVARNFTRDVVALGGVDYGVFIAVFLFGLFVVALDKA